MSIYAGNSTVNTTFSATGIASNTFALGNTSVVGSLLVNPSNTALYAGWTGNTHGAEIRTTQDASTNLLLSTQLGDVGTGSAVSLDFACVDTNSVLGAYPQVRIGYTAAYNPYVNSSPDNEAQGWFRVATRTAANTGTLVDQMIIDPYGNAKFTTSAQAPVFYDSGDTGYYVDPAGTSQLSSSHVYGPWYFRSNKGSGVYSGSTNNPPLQAYSDDGGAAFLSFHRSGQYAVNMGLDPDNVLRIGGWSAAANVWQLTLGGNQTIAGTLTTATRGISASSMPAGSVIQAIKVQSPYGEVSVSNGSTAVLISQSITVQANSRLMVIFYSAQCQAIPNQTNWNPQFRVTVDGSDIDIGAATDAYNHAFYDDGGTAARYRPVITGMHLSNALTAGAHTVNLYGGSYNATVVFNYQSGTYASPSGNRRARMIILEIAG